MAEQIIDIRERIEKMRIKFEDDHKSESYDTSSDEKKGFNEEKKEIENSANEVNNYQKNSNLTIKEIECITKKELYEKIGCKY